MTLRDNIEKESESFREAFDKVLECINTTETLAQYETTEKLFKRFVTLYEPATIYVVFLEFSLESLRRGLEKNGK